MWEKLAIWEKLATIAHALGLLFYLVFFYLPMVKNELGVIFFIAVAFGQFWLWCWLLSKIKEAECFMILPGSIRYYIIFIACWLGLLIMLGCLLMGGGIILLWIITVVLYLLLPSFR